MTGTARHVHRMNRRGEPTALDPVAQLKVELHRKLIDRLDLAALEEIKDEQVLAQQIRAAVVEFLRLEQAPLSAAEREDVIAEIVYEVTGLGPLEPLFRDPTISDILVNGPKDCYIERRGKLSRVSVNFRDNAHLLTVIDRICSKVGRRVDESSPMVDARLPDGSRVNAIIPPLAIDGAVLSIRRFGAAITAQQLVEKGAMTEEMLYLLVGLRARAPQHHHLRRHGLGQDHAPQRAQLVHPERRARGDHRGRGGAAAAAGARGAARDAPAQLRGARRGAGARPGEERPAHAPRPHHPRRVPRARGARHAAGDEHRARGVAGDHHANTPRDALARSRR
jgi:hypothetical protein